MEKLPSNQMKMIHLKVLLFLVLNARVEALRYSPSLQQQQGRVRGYSLLSQDWEGASRRNLKDKYDKKEDIEDDDWWFLQDDGRDYEDDDEKEEQEQEDENIEVEAKESSPLTTVAPSVTAPVTASPVSSFLPGLAPAIENFGVPTRSPVRIFPTKVPVDPPTAAPVTAAPVLSPTIAPVIPPTAAPVAPPTSAPVAPPTAAPVGQVLDTFVPTTLSSDENPLDQAEEEEEEANSENDKDNNQNLEDDNLIDPDTLAPSFTMEPSSTETSERFDVELAPFVITIDYNEIIIEKDPGIEKYIATEFTKAFENFMSIDMVFAGSVVGNETSRRRQQQRRFLVQQNLSYTGVVSFGGGPKWTEDGIQSFQASLLSDPAVIAEIIETFLQEENPGASTAADVTISSIELESGSSGSTNGIVQQNNETTEEEDDGISKTGLIIIIIVASVAVSLTAILFFAFRSKSTTTTSRPPQLNEKQQERALQLAPELERSTNKQNDGGTTFETEGDMLSVSTPERVYEEFAQNIERHSFNSAWQQSTGAPPPPPPVPLLAATSVVKKESRNETSQEVVAFY